MATTKTKDSQEAAITAYKGFDKKLQCRGFQYEIGKTYKHKGKVKACESGFHACEYPLDVLQYYEPATSRFALVEQSGTIARHGADSKVASSSLTVKAEIDLNGLIKAAVDFTFSRAKPANGSSNSGTCGAASNSGFRGAASNSGDHGAASNSGERGAASNSGEHGVAAGFGYENRAKSSAKGAIVLVHRNDDGEIVHIRASKVGENGIKPDTWYRLDVRGEFVEAE